MADSRTNEPHDNNPGSDTDPICAICLAPYTGRVYLSPCLHSFCAACLSAWVEVSVLCPLCKSRPEKIHWGVDTTLGLLKTITLTTTSSPVYASYGASTATDQIIRRLDRDVDVPWREALRNVAVQAKEGLSGLTHAEVDRQEVDAALSNSATANIGESESENESDYSHREGRKRDRSDSPVTSNNKRARSRSESRSQSRSRSVTPIDSHPYLYDSGELYTPPSASLRDHPIGHEPPADIAAIDKGDKETDQAMTRIPTRLEVYALGREPYPRQDFPLADEICSTDMTFLTPFLSQDLAVLTNAGTRPLDSVILDHVSSLFIRHGGRPTTSGRVHKRQALKVTKEEAAIQWDVVEQEIAQWIALTPSKHDWNELDMARLFVREMRRIVKKRWTIRRWNSQVLYSPIQPSR